MNTAEPDTEVPFAVGGETVVHLPGGLLGFETVKRYVLASNCDEQPFYRLQAIDDPDLSFVVISPFEVMPEYQPDIPPEDVRSLGLESPDDAMLFNIVTLRSRGCSTINLKGPIVINRYSLVGKQVVISNACEYSVQHPLPVVE